MNQRSGLSLVVLVFLLALLVWYSFSCYRRTPRQPQDACTETQSKNTFDLATRPSQTQSKNTDDLATIPQPSHPYRLAEEFTHLSESTVNGVEKLVLFIGWPRSGHSIIGRMLDAHPNAIVGAISVFRQIKQNLGKSAIFNQIYKESYNLAKWPYSTRSNFRAGGLWQGRFEKLKVIGDIRHPTGLYLSTSPSWFQQHWQHLAKVMTVPIYVVVMVRNPYDMAASATLYEAEYRESGRRGVKAEASPENKYSKVALLKNMAKKTVEQTKAIADMIRLCNMTALEIHHADHVKDPVTVMQKVCDFLSLECSSYYLQKCYSETFKHLSNARYSVVWTPEILGMLEETTRKYPFFQRYTFDKDY